MISERWNRGGGGILGSVRQEEPLKARVDAAQKKLDVHISKLESIHTKLQRKHEALFERIVSAQRRHDSLYAKAYAGELAQVRKMRDMVHGAKLAMEQVRLRLNTVSELGDVVVTLSPCMSMVRGLSSAIGGMMPEASSSMQDLQSIVGDLVSNSSVASSLGAPAAPAGGEAQSILAEAQAVMESRAKSSIPEVPSELGEQRQKSWA